MEQLKQPKVQQQQQPHHHDAFSPYTELVYNRLEALQEERRQLRRERSHARLSVAASPLQAEKCRNPRTPGRTQQVASLQRSQSAVGLTPPSGTCRSSNFAQPEVCGQNVSPKAATGGLRSVQSFKELPSASAQYSHGTETMTREASSPRSEVAGSFRNLQNFQDQSPRRVHFDDNNPMTPVALAHVIEVMDAGSAGKESSQPMTTPNRGSPTSQAYGAPSQSSTSSNNNRPKKVNSGQKAPLRNRNCQSPARQSPRSMRNQCLQELFSRCGAINALDGVIIELDRKSSMQARVQETMDQKKGSAAVAARECRSPRPKQGKAVGVSNGAPSPRPLHRSPRLSASPSQRGCGQRSPGSNRSPCHRIQEM